MRLHRLEIGGFGRLSDFSADFDPRITVLLGDNESGKSTVQRALRAALYGLDAGGPGRPTDRSDWARWTPWAGEGYSLALTYDLGDGRRLRVARRFEQRDHTCQVQEIGGGDVTAQVRVGRTVSPGLVHLGIDEDVFCASACVGEDGLRLGAGDAPAARATEMQEAIERLADSGGGTTGAEALAAISDAIGRVGSERRSGSPLGRAVNRLRQLEVQVEDARRSLRALAADEERLRALEVTAHTAEERRLDAERRWLLGRLAAIAAQRADLESTDAEVAQMAAEMEGTAQLATFPLEAEDRVASLAAEVLESQRAADEARARSEAAAPQLAEVRRRRAEIAAGLRALGRGGAVDDAAVAEASALERRLAETLAGRRRSEELAAAAGRREALRREIAATGVAGTSAAGVEAAIELVDVARGGRSSRVAKLGATVALCAGAVAAALSAASRHGLWALVAAGVALVATLLILSVDRLFAGDAEHARRRLARLCPGVELDGEGLERLAERLPRLRALHAELQREDLRVETLAAEVETAAARLGELAQAAASLASHCEISPVRSRGARSAEETVRDVLDAVSGAAGIDRRREELSAEDAILEQREADLDDLAGDTTARRRAADAARARLVRVLELAGVPSSLPPSEAVVAFRAGCTGRRRHDAAIRRLGELRRRSSLGADVKSLDRLAVELEARLAARGGDPADIAAAEPLDHSRLQDLETESEHARQGAVAASTEAAALRARLAAMRATVPALADLEDERAVCLAARDRGLHQLAALHRAAELIADATRGIHRDLAPRLAASVAERLALLTEGRYAAVNVDTSHFEVSLLGGDRLELVPLDVVSHGTRDQVSLLLRLALAEVLSGAGEGVPLLLDEPLLSADPQRRATALRFLWNLSATNQVVLSTSDPGMVDALEGVCDGQAPAVLTMPSGASTIETTGRVIAMARLL
ncbi:MAG TPA: AAA family ATPase [Candidatus Dormibacteraeota bacterium]|jgi:DNA repair exonuclease SbcCD ATPase subunit|nr:AAA family ATPase [Candidatus Dormibacteraeota bacterium]